LPFTSVPRSLCMCSVIYCRVCFCPLGCRQAQLQHRPASSVHTVTLNSDRRAVGCDCVDCAKYGLPCRHIIKCNIVSQIHPVLQPADIIQRWRPGRDPDTFYAEHMTDEDFPADVPQPTFDVPKTKKSRYTTLLAIAKRLCTFVAPLI